jgi:hypothetical protein
VVAGLSAIASAAIGEVTNPESVVVSTLGTALGPGRHHCLPCLLMGPRGHGPQEHLVLCGSQELP